MKKTTSAAQEYYMLAKAGLEVLKEEATRIENEYTVSQNIVNEGGEIAKTLYSIDNDDIFDRVSIEAAELIEASGLGAELNEACETLKAAENALIAWGLLHVPTSLADTQREGAKVNYITQQKLIEIILKLDASTV